jgi:hypothetical protein
MPKLWAVFDLDGTLCDYRHRIDFAKAKDWDGFHSRCPGDPPYLAEIMIAQAWAKSGGFVAYNTGRTEPYRTLTRLWMSQHGLPAGPLFMREHDDHRPSKIAKEENLSRLEDGIMEKGDQIVFIMEDKDTLVAHWRDLGYTCLQPRFGEY